MTPTTSRPIGTKPLNTGGWIGRATKLPTIVPAFTITEPVHLSSSPPTTPVLLLHGFTGCAAAMAPLSSRLAQTLRCIAVDLVGHGATQSPADLGQYSLESFVRSLDALLDDQLNTELDATPAHVVGYSLGGRAALTFANQRPNKCASLTLIGASPGIADTQQRMERRRQDFALARRISQHGLASFVREWTSQPMWDSLRKRISPSAWEASLAQRASSHPLGLAHSLRGAGAGAMAPLWDKLGEMQVPTLVLTGSEDTKFTEIGAAMASQMPSSRFVAVPDAGHAAHLEQPEAVAEMALGHITAVDPATK